MNLSMRAIRNDFQDRFPHYTPPPWAGDGIWLRWYEANIRLHGADGFEARFPRHCETVLIIDDPRLPAAVIGRSWWHLSRVVENWRALSYRNGLQA